MEWIIIALLIMVLFKDDIIKIAEAIRGSRTKAEEDEKPDERKKEFDKLMDYSIEDAIKSKRSDIDG